MMMTIQARLIVIKVMVMMGILVFLLRKIIPISWKYNFPTPLGGNENLRFQWNNAFSGMQYSREYFFLSPGLFSHSLRVE